MYVSQKTDIIWNAGTALMFVSRQNNKVQRYYCKACKKYQQIFYKYKAYSKDANTNIILYKKEICGMRGVARIMKISIQ
jgi:transposase-like protein